MGIVIVMVLLVSLLVWTSPVLAYGEQLLKKGMSGEDVRRLQGELRDRGYELTVDGEFGPETEAVVKQFQKDLALPVDGIVGPQTFEALAAERTDQGEHDSKRTESKRDAESSRGAFSRTISSDTSSQQQDEGQKVGVVSQDEILDKLYQFASEFMGTPYRYGGTGKSGIDCSSLTQQALSRLGVSVPRRSADQYRVGTAVLRSELRSGDLVFFSTTGRGVTHVAVYLEDGKLLNATSSAGVSYTRLSESYWNRNYYGARRVLP